MAASLFSTFAAKKNGTGPTMLAQHRSRQGKGVRRVKARTNLVHVQNVSVVLGGGCGLSRPITGPVGKA